MVKNQKKSDSWLGLTILMMVILAAVLFFILFPSEAYALVEDHLYIIFASIAFIAVGFLVRSVIIKLKEKRAAKIESKRKKRIQLIEQIIWRGRYNLNAKKAQILADDTAESHDLWKQEKIQFAREKIFPVIPESEAPMNLISSLIEKSISGSGMGSGRLPTYKVQNL